MNLALVRLSESSTTTNALGGTRAYRIVPGENCRPFAQPRSSIAARAGYMWNHLWVTPFDANELYPAGEFPNQHPGGDGLPRWTAANRDINDREIVVWYVMGSPPHGASTRLAGDAGVATRVHAEAGWVLHAQPIARRGSFGRALVSHMRHSGRAHERWSPGRVRSSLRPRRRLPPAASIDDEFAAWTAIGAPLAPPLGAIFEPIDAGGVEAVRVVMPTEIDCHVSDRHSAAPARVEGMGLARARSPRRGSPRRPNHQHSPSDPAS